MPILPGCTPASTGEVGAEPQGNVGCGPMGSFGVEDMGYPKMRVGIGKMSMIPPIARVGVMYVTDVTVVVASTS